MQAVIALGLVLACGLAAQVDKPAEPVLQNTGKSMVLDYACTDEDVRLAGLSCSIDDPCPIYVELASVEAVGNRIFLVGNIHTATTTLYSVLLATTDNGKTWREPHERMRASGLDRIQFLDFENGWISGEVQHPLPRDPFFLVTSDGGQTWRLQPVFGDPQFGSILQFAFTSHSSGAMIIDRGRGWESGRYELYETPNAGETWMLRQSNEKAIQLKRTAGASSDWRLHADAATKAYRVERRSGESWRSIGSFSVSIGACKPEPPPPPPPGPEVPTSPPPGR